MREPVRQADIHVSEVPGGLYGSEDLLRGHTAQVGGVGGVGGAALMKIHSHGSFPIPH